MSWAFTKSVHKFMSDDHIIQTSIVQRDLLSAFWSLFSHIRIAAATGFRDKNIVGLSGSWHKRDAVFTVYSGLIFNGCHSGPNDAVLTVRFIENFILYLSYNCLSYEKNGLLYPEVTQQTMPPGHFSYVDVGI